MEISFQLGEWMNHRLKKKSAHSIHSPFLFDWYQIVYKGKLQEDIIANYRRLKKEIKNDHQTLFHQDFGAGSKKVKTSKPTISQLASASLKSESEAALIARTADYFQARKILEFGTSFGLTTALLAMVNPDAEIITLEGSEAVAQRASMIFDQLPQHGIRQIISQFDLAIEQKSLEEYGPFDMMIIDGNHRMKPTLHYFDYLLDFCSEDAVFVFDDIRWSKEMLNAWKIISSHPRITLALDMFGMGIGFLNPDLSKEYYFI